MKPSGSKLQLLDHCAYWARPDVAAPNEESSEPADYGTYVHKLTELMIKASSYEVTIPEGAAQSLKLERVEQAFVDAVDLYEWQRDAFDSAHERQCEVGFSYNIRTHAVKMLPPGGRDSYATASEDEICATLDLVIRKGNYFACVDFKTGSAPDWKYEKQLRFGALLVSRFYDAKEVECIIARPNLAPSMWVETEDTLDDYAVDLVARLKAATGAEPTPGIQCHDLYCPMRTTCPVTQALVKQLPSGMQLPVLGEITSPEHATFTLERLALARDALDAIENKVKKYAIENGGINLPDGRVYTQVERTTRSIVLTDGAEQVLAHHLGPEYETAIEKKLTQAAIERLATKLGNGKASKVKKQIMADLEEVSAIKRHTHLQFDYIKR